MGSLPWEDNTAFNGCFRTTLGSLGYTPNSGNLFCPVLVTVTSGMADADKAIYGRNNGAYVFAKDSAYATAADFKTAVTGKYMIFSLANPTTETTDPYTNPQTVFVGGTEEFTDYGVAQGQRDVAIPVGQSTEYYQEA